MPNTKTTLPTPTKLAQRQTTLRE